LRAIEEGLPVARSAITGISAVIDARGRIVTSLGLNQSGVIDAGLPEALPPTPYARFGDLGFAIILLACATIAGVLSQRRQTL
jgi:apolipoprotein N-acyltransferase